MQNAFAVADERITIERSRKRTPTQRATPPVDSSSLDPVQTIVAGIVGIVPASRWTFGKVDSGGNLASYFGSTTDVDACALLAEEYRRLRMRTPGGPRIAATLKAGPEFSGVTLVFADARANYGILTLLREADVAPFTSSEISMLTLALDAVSEHLAALRLQSPALDLDRSAEILPTERESAFFVLDDQFRIKMSWSTLDENATFGMGLHFAAAERLPLLLEQTVRELTVAWSPAAVCRPGVARPVPFLVVRTRPMSGPEGSFIGVRIERYQENNSLTAVAARFHISPRESQVLTLVLDGNQLEHIAKRLYITSSTVQDHIKSMLDKTNSRNRSELIARVLGWQYEPRTVQA